MVGHRLGTSLKHKNRPLLTPSPKRISSERKKGAVHAWVTIQRYRFPLYSARARLYSFAVMETLPYTAEEAVEICELGYKRKGESEQKYRARTREDLEAMGYEDIVFCDTRGAQVFAARKDGRMLIVPRGTDSPSDILSDLFAIPSIDDVIPGSVHKGFKRQASALEVKLNREGYTPNEGDEVWLIPHSLGAAIGTILGGRYSKSGAKVFIVSFGCPRAGSRAFFRKAGKVTHWRFENRADPICKVPPPGLFVHDVPPLFFDRHGHLTAEPTRFTRLWESSRALIGSAVVAIKKLVSFPLRLFGVRLDVEHGGVITIGDHLLSSAYKPRIKQAEKEIEGNLLEEYRSTAETSSFSENDPA